MEFFKYMIILYKKHSELRSIVNLISVHLKFVLSYLFNTFEQLMLNNIQ